MHERSIACFCDGSLAVCGARFIYLGRFHEVSNLVRPLLILAAIAALALVAGFLAFGGGNMGN
jgi:hypothetical protein